MIDYQKIMKFRITFQVKFSHMKDIASLSEYHYLVLYLTYIDAFVLATINNLLVCACASGPSRRLIDADVYSSALLSTIFEVFNMDTFCAKIINKNKVKRLFISIMFQIRTII